MKIKTAIAVAITAVAIFSTCTYSANAGTYPWYQCHPAVGYSTTGDWYWGAGGFPNGLSGCAGTFKMAGHNGAGTYYNPGKYLWWSTPTLTGGLKFTNLSTAVGSGSQGRMWSTIRFCTPGPVVDGICSMVYGKDVSDSASTTHSIGCDINQPTYGQCDRVMFAFSTRSGNYETNVAAHFYFWDLAFTINDPTAPFAWQPHNGTFRNDNSTNPWTDGNYWNAGTKTVGVYGYDPSQSGISQTRLFFDGDPGNGLVAQVFDKSCNYANWRPCSEFVADTAYINTTAFADGPHTATTRVVDAGGNTSEATTNFKVDNTRPSTPSNVDVIGATQGWSSSNDFDLAWTNGTEEYETATQSGIASVTVNVEPTDAGSQTNPPRVIIPVGQTVSGVSATRTSVSGVTVPAIGEWKVRLWVTDKAGNDSEVGDGTSGTADSDFNIGYDPTPPARPNGRANGWISRGELASGYNQEWQYTSLINQFAPICGFAGSITLADADPGAAINIPGNVREWQLPANLTEANHKVNLRAVTCAGLASPTTEHVDAKVDLTDPAPSYSGVEEGRWYQDGKVVTVGGSDALSGMTAGTGTGLNGYETGAYIDYSINGAAPSGFDVPRGGSANLTVTGEGQKDLRFAPVDVAGNKAKETVVRFGIDASDPTGHFAERDPKRPTVLSAPIGDDVSGLNLAAIEVRRSGSGDDWQMLPTSLADLSGNAVAGAPKSALAAARFPDTSLPQGTYEARVRAYDQAGNALVTDRDINGNKYTFENPMRDGVALSAGLLKAKRTCGKKRGVKCIKRTRGKVVYVGAKPTLAVAYKRGAVVAGFLTTPKLTALAREPIEIYSRVPGHDEQLLGTTSTRADGSYTFKIKPGVSQTIRVYYPGTETRQDASTTVLLGTGAKLRLRASTRHARTGQTITFRGSVRSFDGSIPAAGKIVALQFYAGRKWRPAVAIAHTDSKGNFSVKYKFDRISKGVKARIVFRVFAPAEDGWNHVASASRRITMRLN